MVPHAMAAGAVGVARALPEDRPPVGGEGVRPGRRGGGHARRPDAAWRLVHLPPAMAVRSVRIGKELSTYTAEVNT